MNKKLSTGLKTLFIIIAAALVVCIFGFGSITKFVFKKMLFTPYNIVGIIMTVVTICGGYITKRQGHWIKLALTILCGVVSAFSFACTICSWFNIDVLNIIWTKALRPAAISVGTVLLWILIVAVGILVVGFAIYGLIVLICYIKEEKKWKTDRKSYQSQKSIVNQIAKENAKPNIKTATTVTRVQKTVTNIQQAKPIQQNTEKPKLQPKEASKQVALPNHYELSISNNLCPRCGWYLKKRINKETGVQFRGCTNYGYHDCPFTISDDEYMRIYKKYH